MAMRTTEYLLQEEAERRRQREEEERQKLKVEYAAAMRQAEDAGVGCVHVIYRNRSHNTLVIILKSGRFSQHSTAMRHGVASVAYVPTHRLSICSPACY